MKLNPEELQISSFETLVPDAVSGDSGTISPDPTPMTMCYWCPQRTIGCTE